MNPDETPAAELWRRTLSQIPTIFGRLVYLTSLRDANTGRYVHFGFAQRFTDREADQALRRSHLNTFDDWLSFSLEEQKDDLEEYIARLDQDRETVLSHWKSFSPFPNLIPAATKGAQRELYLSDLQIVLEMMR